MKFVTDNKNQTLIKLGQIRKAEVLMKEGDLKERIKRVQEV